MRNKDIYLHSLRQKNGGLVSSWSMAPANPGVDNADIICRVRVDIIDREPVSDRHPKPDIQSRKLSF